MPDNDQAAIVRELYGRRAQLPPDKVAIVDELAKRYGIAGGSAPAANPVAPGTSDDDIISAFGYDPATIKKSARYQADVKKYGSGLTSLLSDPNRNDIIAKINDSPAGDLAMGGYDVLSGIRQLGIHTLNKLGAVSDEDAAYVDLMTKVAQADYLQNIRHGHKPSTIMRLLGNIAVPIPGGPGMAAGGMGTKVARAAVQGAIGAGAQPVTEGGPGDYWTQKGKQIATGAAVGAAIPPVASGAGRLATKVANARAGRGIAPRAADAMETAERIGMPLTPGDVTRNPVLQKAETLLESVPVVGTGGIRAEQQAVAKSQAGALAGKLEKQFRETSLGGIDDVIKAADEGDEAARKLLDKFQVAGQDPDRVLQASIGLSNFRTRQTAKQLYDKVQEIVEQNNLPDVTMTKTVKTVTRALQEAESAKLKDPGLIKILKEIRDNITPKRVPVPETPVPTNAADFARWKAEQEAAKAATTPANNSYGAIRRLRSDLGDKIEMYMSGDNALIGEKGVGLLQSVRNSIEQDLSSFIQQSRVPKLQTAAMAADKYYKAARVPFKDGMLAQAAVDTEPDQIFQRFIKAGKGDRAQKFFEALDPKGRAAVKYQIVADAINKATDMSKGEGGIFSPQKFYNALDNIDDAYGVFFKGRDKWEVDGFKNLMAHVTRAGQYAENPPTGNRAVPLIWAGLGLGAAHFNPQATAGAAAVLAAAKPLMMSNAGKRFLLAASSAKPGSPAMQKLVDRLSKELPELGGRASTARSGNTEPQQ